MVSQGTRRRRSPDGQVAAGSSVVDEVKEEVVWGKTPNGTGKVRHLDGMYF